MKRIYLQNAHSYTPNASDKYALAIGFFDGVHLGHQQVLNEAKKVAREKQLISAVMTFSPHPSVVLGNSKKPVPTITPIDEKLKRFEEMGMEVAFIVQFTSSFAQLSPEQFIQNYLVQLHVKHVIAGYDFTFGEFGKGTMNEMQHLGAPYFETTTVQKLADEQEKISSTRIRQALKDGDVTLAHVLLSRPHRASGLVVHGDKRGRTIGFPTANVYVTKEWLIPATGVYAARLFVNDRWLDGVCNIGYKPTFKGEENPPLTIEIHLFDFDEDIYGEQVEIEWIERIRSEQKFSSIDELINQISKDKKTAKQIFLSI